jgi:hypothetical protein
MKFLQSVGITDSCLKILEVQNCSWGVALRPVGNSKEPHQAANEHSYALFVQTVFIAGKLAEVIQFSAVFRRSIR